MSLVATGRARTALLVTAIAVALGLPAATTVAVAAERPAGTSEESVTGTDPIQEPVLGPATKYVRNEDGTITVVRS